MRDCPLATMQHGGGVATEFGAQEAPAAAGPGLAWAGAEGLPGL